MSQWLDRIAFSPWIHRPVIWGTTVNFKDVLCTGLMFTPMLFAAAFGARLWIAFLGTAALIAFQPALLVFPFDILMSLWCWRSPAVWNPHQLIPDLKASFLDPTTFARLRTELMAIATVPLVSDVLPNQQDIASDKWRLLPIRTFGSTNARLLSQMPCLAELIHARPDILTVFYSKLDGHSRIAPHTGLCKAVLRVHIGINIPEPGRAAITVNGERLEWRQGEAIAFDDMYVHGVEHSGDQPRAVLWMDVVRPDIRNNRILNWATHRLLSWIADSTWVREVERRTENVLDTKTSVI